MYKWLLDPTLESRSSLPFSKPPSLQSTAICCACEGMGRGFLSLKRQIVPEVINTKQWCLIAPRGPLSPPTPSSPNTHTHTTPSSHSAKLCNPPPPTHPLHLTPTPLVLYPPPSQLYPTAARCALPLYRSISFSISLCAIVVRSVVGPSACGDAIINYSLVPRISLLSPLRIG